MPPDSPKVPVSIAVLLVVTALAIGMCFAPRPALAQGAMNLLVQLNGTPTKIGTLTSAGASVNNSTTATPFTVSAGDVLMVECDAAVNVGPGTTASATLTNVAYLPKVNAAPDARFFILNTNSLAMVGAGNCAVFRMR